MKRMRHIALPLLIVLAAALLVTLRVAPRLLADWWWFGSLGYASVFGRMLLAKCLLWLAGFGAGLGATASGILLARSGGPESVMFYRWGRRTVRLPSLRRIVRTACWVGAVCAGLVGGAAATALWHRVLLFLCRVSFGIPDPIYGNDVGFYVFVFPLLRVVHPLLLVLVWLSLGASVVIYVADGALLARGLNRLPRAVFRHLSCVVGVVFLLMAAGYWLQRYELLYGHAGVVYGAGYTDVHARLVGYWVMIAASAAAGVAFLAAPSPGALRALALVMAGWVCCAILTLLVVPPLVQRVKVRPNELALERPFIGHAIEATRRGYSLDRVRQAAYPAQDDLDYGALLAEGETIRNIPLWDEATLTDVYRATQSMRPYYDFGSVTTDRYKLGGRLAQLMLSVREMRPDRLPETARTWANTRLAYTHGYGLCASPVSDVTAEGAPAMAVKDIPPVAPPEMRLDTPEVYYGTEGGDYVFVDTRVDEFDHPAGAEDAHARYRGAGGVPVVGLLRKLVFALYFGDPNILLSGDLTAGSRVLYRRGVAERVGRLAPYLLLDGAPYAVVDAGRIYWIQDAYTTSRYYPYSEPVEGGRYNYIRNSVKAVVDAYDGTVRFYVSDPDDPMVRVYSRVFPGLYQRITMMPEGLRRHVRYPRDLFGVQALKYCSFHVRDERVFYKSEDVWDIAPQPRDGGERTASSSYVTLRLPEGERAEFVLMAPLIARGRDGMVGWFAALCDGEPRYPLTAFLFPKGRLVYGPSQVRTRMDQDAQVVQQTALLAQQGGEVMRGRMVVVPVAGGILYVEPLFVRAEPGGVPHLKRVVAAFGERVVIAPTLEASLASLFAQQPGPSAAAPASLAVPETRAALGLLHTALGRYEQSQRALQRSDWETYGRSMADMKDALDRLDALLSGQQAAPE